MTDALPRQAKALICVRALNQLGAYTLPFLAVLAPPGQVPLTLATFGLAALASRFAGALLLDGLPPRTVIVLGLAATGTSLLLLSAAEGSVPLLCAVVLVGLAFEIYEPATQEALAATTPSAAHGRVYNLLGTSLVAAGALAGLLAAVLLPLGVRGLIVADALTCFLAAAVAITLLDGTRARRPVPPGRWRPPRTLLRLTAAATAFAYGSLAVLMFIPLVLLQRGAPPWLPGLTLTAAALLAPLTGHIGRRIPDGLGHTRILAVGTVVLGGSAFAMYAVRSLPLTIAAYLTWAAVDSVLQGRWPAMIAGLAPEPDRPRWFAVHGSSWGVAQPAVPALAALAGGTAAAALLTGAAAFLLVPLALGFHRRDPPEPALDSDTGVNLYPPTP
ncbi:MFS transporter [Actinomadura fibrosa]|uniref:MFS transporter n=1 Tax=Actinomadura fibrosa TaxID=111802 RepID=A0ABW2XIN7_9ACTN|nr:MFS transporter [Actinomadura fibrosa]